MQKNPKDPLIAATSDQARRLHEAFSKVADGAPNDVVLQAAFSMILGAVRQKHARRMGALADFDEMMGKFRHLLAEKHLLDKRQAPQHLPVPSVDRSPAFRRAREAQLAPTMTRALNISVPGRLRT